jgi:hypothetical protein
MRKEKPLQWVVPQEESPKYAGEPRAARDPADNFDWTDVSWPGAFSEMTEPQVAQYEA